LTSSIRRLVLYEGWPPVNPDAWALPPGIGPRVDALLADGDGEAVAEMVFRELVMMPQQELSALRAQPSWPARVAAAQMIPARSGPFSRHPSTPSGLRRSPCPHSC
jgi:hypothetical protein